MTSYRLDRRYVLPAIGFHLIAAGVVAALAFFVWGPLGILVVLILLNAVRLAVLPPVSVRLDQTGARLGGLTGRSAARIEWSQVEDVSLDRGRLVIRQQDEEPVVLSLAALGSRSGEFAREVYDRLNAANGYTKYDPPAT